MEGLSMQNNHLQKDSTEGFCGRIPEGSTEGKKIKYQLNHSMFRLTLSKQLTSNMVTITLWPHKADSLATFLHWFVCPGPCFSFLICSHLKCAPDDENSNWLFEISACPPKARAGVQWVGKKTSPLACSMFFVAPTWICIEGNTSSPWLKLLPPWSLNASSLAKPICLSIFCVFNLFARLWKFNQLFEEI